MSVEFANHQEKFGRIFESFEFWPEIHDGDVVVDLGCGGGMLTRELASQFPKAKFIGLDVKESLIHVARTRGEGLPSTEFRAMNACDEGGLGIENAQGIFCRFLMEDLPNPKQALANMYNALKPGGWICTAERLNSFYKVYPESPAIEKAWNSIYSFYEKEYSAHPGITKHLPSLLEEVGFRDVRVKGYSVVLSRLEFGETFDWYIQVAQKMIQDNKNVLIKSGLESEETLNAAIADYQSLLKDSNSFVLETAICVSGRK